MRSVLQLTVLALAFAVMTSFGTVAPTHEVSADGAVISRDSVPLSFEHPCDPGSLLSGTVKYVFEERQVFENGQFVHYNANYTSHGTFTDANGLKYIYKQSSRGIIHDELPQNFSSKAKVTSQGGGDNWELVETVHVNEQGIVTKVEFNEECKG